MSENTAPCDKLHQLLSIQAARQPDGVALWWNGAATTYASLNNRVLALAARLAGEGASGDRVAVLAWNCPEFIELIYAVPASGRVLVPLNARLAPAELIHQLQSAGVTTLFGDPQLLQPLLREQALTAGVRVIDLEADYEQWLESGAVAPLPQCDTSDPVWILYTSGSTGRPKGAVLTHHSFMAGLRSAALARPVLETDKYLYPFPLFHVAAHNVSQSFALGAHHRLRRVRHATNPAQAASGTDRRRSVPELWNDRVIGECVFSHGRGPPAGGRHPAGITAVRGQASVHR